MKKIGFSKHEFYTDRGYTLLKLENNKLTPSMEDYLEMILRLSQKQGYTRIGDLAGALNVQPPSVTRMINKLAELDYLSYEKYGTIQLTEQGQKISEYLLNRHRIIEKFLLLMGVTEKILEETEKMEHSISKETLEKIKLFIEFMQENPAIIKDLRKFQKKFIR